MAQPASQWDPSDDQDSHRHIPVGDLEPKLVNLMQQSEALVALMSGFFKQLDQRRSEEFQIIAGYIARCKEEIREMRPHDISHERIPTAGAELEAITRDTETATHTIMNCAEAMMGFDLKAFGDDPKAYKAAIDDEVMKIFEACSFQDITGQRVSKVINVLKQIEDRVGHLAKTLGVDDGKPAPLTAEEKRRQALLLNGPAINGPETQQDAIDAMFDEAPAYIEPAVKLDALAAKPAPVATPQPVAAAPAPAPEPAPATVPPAVDNSQDDIDALFDIAPEDMGKTNSQDDIDALFD